MLSYHSRILEYSISQQVGVYNWMVRECRNKNDRWARYWWEMDAYLAGNYHKQNGQHVFQKVNSEFHQEALQRTDLSLIAKQTRLSTSWSTVMMVAVKLLVSVFPYHSAIHTHLLANATLRFCSEIWIHILFPAYFTVSVSHWKHSGLYSIHQFVYTL